MSSSIEALRIAVRDETLPLAERRTAAELYVAAIVDTVPEPADDDTEIIALMTRPSADGPLGDILTRAWEIGNERYGWARSGPTLAQARRHLQEQRRTRLLESIYKNRDLEGLEREAAAQRIVDALPPSSMLRHNGVTAQRLIAEAS